MFDGILNWLSGGEDKVLLSADDLRAGKHVVEGRLQGEQTILSPASSIPCLAFYYRATYLAGSRVRASTRRRLRDSLCYASGMTLEIEGGEIELETDSSEVFTPDEHASLLETGAEGIKVSEERIVANARVRVVGRLRKSADDSTRWILKFSEIAAVEGGSASPAESRLDPKDARARRKKIKSKKGAGNRN